MWKYTVAIFLMTSVGCAGDRAALSAGQIGCRKSDIVISEEDTGNGYANWVATCHGKSYLCTSEATGGKYGGSSTRCTELQKGTKGS